jgi:hypothetical protein
MSLCSVSCVGVLLSVGNSASPNWLDARKIENEGFNVLKNNGYELEHNFGHGKINLSKVLAVLNLLAFAFHEICDRAEPQWQKARSANTRVRFFTDISAYCNVKLFESWTQLIDFCVSLLPKPIRTLKGPYCGP